MKKLILSALLSGVAASAMATDLPGHRGAPVAPLVYQPAFTWGGLYVGINGGYDYGDISGTNFARPEGGLIGGTVGYNWQTGSWVYGVEGDFDYAFTKHDNTFAFSGGTGSNTYKTDWLTTERVRFGYAYDRALFYVTGGLAVVQNKGTVNDGAASFSKEEWRVGGTIGAGAEYAITDNVSAKAEYLWVPVEDQKFWSGQAYEEKNSLSSHLFRAGLNYKF